MVVPSYQLRSLGGHSPSFGGLWQIDLVVELQGFDSGPDFRCQGTAELSNQGQLMLLGISLEIKKLAR